jgi:hypothetical protein
MPTPTTTPTPEPLTEARLAAVEAGFASDRVDMANVREAVRRLTSLLLHPPSATVTAPGSEWVGIGGTGYAVAKPSLDAPGASYVLAALDATPAPEPSIRAGLEALRDAPPGAVIGTVRRAANDLPRQPWPGEDAPPLGNIRILPSQPLRDCIVEWMGSLEREDGMCPRCRLNRTDRVCDQCLGDLDAILAREGPRWMANAARTTDSYGREDVVLDLDGLEDEVRSWGRRQGTIYTSTVLSLVAEARRSRALPPALTDDARETLRSAAVVLDPSTLTDDAVGWDPGYRATLAARLRALAGEP